MSIILTDWIEKIIEKLKRNKNKQFVFWSKRYFVSYYRSVEWIHIKLCKPTILCNKIVFFLFVCKANFYLPTLFALVEKPMTIVILREKFILKFNLLGPCFRTSLKQYGYWIDFFLILKKVWHGYKSTHFFSHCLLFIYHKDILHCINI